MHWMIWWIFFFSFIFQALGDERTPVRVNVLMRTLNHSSSYKEWHLSM
jgi:Na+-driven multidrug efflux pump